MLITEKASSDHWFVCRISDTAHCSRKYEGKVRPVVERAEILERVCCATGSSATTSIGPNLGGGLGTIGAMYFYVLGVGSCRERSSHHETDLDKNVGVHLAREQYSCFRGVYHHI